MDFRSMAQLVRAVGCGAEAHEFCVFHDGVFFANQAAADVFAQRHGAGGAIEVKEPPVNGWFVKSKPIADDDPIIAVIKQALRDEEQRRGGAPL